MPASVALLLAPAQLALASGLGAVAVVVLASLCGCCGCVNPGTKKDGAYGGGLPDLDRIISPSSVADGPPKPPGKADVPSTLILVRL